jgi:hypothetical protein
VGLRTILDTVMKRKISSPRWESNRRVLRRIFGPKRVEGGRGGSLYNE